MPQQRGGNDGGTRCREIERDECSVAGGETRWQHSVVTKLRVVVEGARAAGCREIERGEMQRGEEEEGFANLSPN